MARTRGCADNVNGPLHDADHFKQSPVRAEQPEKTGPPTRKSWFQRIFELGIIAAITLGLLEAILRVTGLTQPILYVADDHAGYRLKPDQQVTYVGNGIAINRWGVRDARDFDTKPLATHRIVVLGDSVTWGGIREKQENLFTSVLEGALPNTEVINCGVNGYSVTQMVELYTHHLDPLNPDRVLVFAIPRDFTRPPMSKLAGNGLAFPQEAPRSAVYAALSLVRHLAAERFNWDWLQPPPAALPTGPEASTEESLASNVDALSGLLASKGTDGLLVALLPTAEGSPDADMVPRIEEELRLRNVPFENLAQHGMAQPEYFVDGIHLSSEGHRAAGTILADILLAEVPPELTSGML